MVCQIIGQVSCHKVLREDFDTEYVLSTLMEEQLKSAACQSGMEAY